MLAQAGLAGPGGEPERLRAALGVVPCRGRDRLDQGGLARPVVPDQEGHPGGQSQTACPVEVPHDRQGEGVAAGVGVRLHPHLLHEPTPGAVHVPLR